MPCEMEQIGDCTLYRGDALEVAPTLTGIAVVIADPPYGIGFDFTKMRPPSYALPHAGHRLQMRTSRDPDSGILGDDQCFDPRPWLSYRQVILWGANHYAALLPVSASWLIWDKRCGGTSNDFGDCELAWTNLRGSTRIHYQLSRGALRAGEENPSRCGKVYPSQKPVALMRWCIAKTTGLILDPYMGSGSTCVAAREMGRPCIGIDLSVQAFDIACQRLYEAQQQYRLFAAEPPPPLAQEVLFT